MSSTSPVVSIIIPCYNGERFIRDSVECVLGQTCRDVEVVVVDDGSSDASREILSQLDADDRVRVIHHDSNRGIAAARNTGVHGSTGRYLAFLDQDDTWRPDKLERQLDYMEREENAAVGLVFTGRDLLRDERRIQVRGDRDFPRPLRDAGRRDVLAALIRRNFIPLISVLVRRSCIDDVGAFDDNIRSGADDYEFCVRVVEKYPIDFIDEVLVTRREHGANFANIARLLPDNLLIIDRIAAIEPSLRAEGERTKSDLLADLGRRLHIEGDRSRAREAYRNALQINPGNAGASTALLLLGMGPFGDAIVRIWRFLKGLVIRTTSVSP